MDKIKRFLPHILAVYCSAIFLSSLPFKFSNASETQTIFGILNDWAATFGAGGIFSQTGLFSQYMIGGAELLAAAALLLGILPRFRRLQGFGALLGIAVMSGAISFHLFTPLGIDPNNDGGLLFVMACGVWISSLIILIFRKDYVIEGIKKIGCALFGKPVPQ